MAYPKDLDEYTNAEIETEHNRRIVCRNKNICFYCGKPLSNGIQCRLASHNLSESTDPKSRLLNLDE